MDGDILLTAVEVGLLTSHQPIKAIKSVRERIVCSLLDAKTAVERYADKMNLRSDRLCNTCKGTGVVKEWSGFPESRV